MPRYFFHVRKSDHKPDSTGVELRDASEARIEAAKAMAQELKDNPGDLWKDEEWHIEVTDEKGLILFTVYSSAVEAAASGR